MREKREANLLLQLRGIIGVPFDALARIFFFDTEPRAASFPVARLGS